MSSKPIESKLKMQQVSTLREKTCEIQFDWTINNQKILLEDRHWYLRSDEIVIEDFGVKLWIDFNIYRGIRYVFSEESSKDNVQIAVSLFGRSFSNEWNYDGSSNKPSIKTNTKILPIVIHCSGFDDAEKEIQVQETDPENTNDETVSTMVEKTDERPEDPESRENDDLQNQITSEDKNFSLLSKTLEEKEETISKMSLEISTLSSRLEDQQSILNAIKELTEGYNRKLSQKDAEILEFQTQISSMEKLGKETEDQLMKDIEGKDQTISNAQSKIQELMLEMTTLQESKDLEINELSTELNLLKSSVELHENMKKESEAAYRKKEKEFRQKIITLEIQSEIQKSMYDFCTQLSRHQHGYR